MKLELKSLLKLTSLISVIVLVTACASNETQDGDGTGSTSDGSSSSGAMASGTGADGGLSSGSMDGSGSGDGAGELKTVFYFDFDQSSLDADTRAALDAQIARLKNTNDAIRLEGHADDRGTREYNLALGERRAKAVADYMAFNGIARSRIETISYGEEKPVAVGQNESSWSLNRRVELK